MMSNRITGLLVMAVLTCAVAGCGTSRAELQSQISDIRVELKQAQIEFEHSEDALMRTQEQLQELNEDWFSLVRELAAVRKAMRTERNNSAAMLKIATTENAALKRELDSVKTQRDRAVGRTKNADKIIASMKLARAAAMADRARMEKIITTIRTERAELAQKIDQLKTKLSAAAK